MTTEAKPAEASEPPAHGPANAAKPTPVDIEALAGRKVLVVDDDVRNLYAVTSLLERSNLVVIPATNARKALAGLEQHPDIELILMDLMMPEMDGYQAIKEIRGNHKFAKLPVVALTAKASEADRTECLACGFNDYVVKPADVRELTAVVAHNLPARARKAEAGTQ